jgi:hypothetical protein
VSEAVQRRSSIFETLRQRFRGPKTLRLSVSAYGKLPVYKDFIRHGLAGREAQAFKQWLDRGMSHHWPVREECRHHQIEPHGVLLHFPGTGHYLCGYLWGSFDEGHLRAFPFALFVSLPTGRGVFAQLAALRVLDQVLAQGARLRQELREVSKVEEVYQILRTTAFEVVIHDEKRLGEELRQEIESVTVERFAGSLYGEFATERWPALCGYLERMEAVRRDGGPLPALRLPASPLLPVVLQAAFWTRLLDPVGLRGETPLNLLFTSTPGPSGLLLLRRPLQPDDAVLFHPKDFAYEGVEDLRFTVPGGGGLSMEIGDSERSLASLLEAPPK